MEPTSAGVVNGDGSSTRSNSRPSHKLFHKFAPFRKRQHLREARSEETIITAEALPSLNEIVDSVNHSLHRSLSRSSVNQKSAFGTPEPTWTVHHYQGSQGSEHLTALPSNSHPPNSPLPSVSPRISSGGLHRNAIAYQNPKNLNTDVDDLSIRLGPSSGNGRQQPRTLVSALSQPTPSLAVSTVEESPVVGGNGSSRQNSYQSMGSKQQPGQASGFFASQAQPQPPTRQDSLLSDRWPVRPHGSSPPNLNVKSNASSIRGPEKIGPEVLAQLQAPSADKSDVFNTELNLADDPESWDVINPNTRTAEDWDRDLYSLERRAEQLYSASHLRVILEDTDSHYRFSAFLRRYRPWRIPILEYYWSTYKAIKALEYANSLAKKLSTKPRLETQGGVVEPPGVVANERLHEAANLAFEELLREDLHWYIANIYINIVGNVMQARITGTLSAPLREASQGLAEVFCITDPTRRDNPIILVSQAFTRHSGCNMDYILGRNCRFMQGPGTTVDSCRRFAVALQEGRDHSEIFVNYRRDGSPFLSLVMNAGLVDSQDNLRYYLGAQVDVSGLLKNCAGLESLTALVNQQSTDQSGDRSDAKAKSAIKSLSKMLSLEELDVIRKHGGSLQKGPEYELQHVATSKRPQRLLLADISDESDHEETLPCSEAYQQRAPDITSTEAAPPQVINLSGVYKYYLIVRPAPSLRVLFASPTLRSPGILQSNFLHRIGGSRMRNDLSGAFQQPDVVTAKVRWLNDMSEDGEGASTTRWIHCTPLMHHTGAIGLWMIVMIMPERKESIPAKSEETSGRSTHRQEDRSVRREDRSEPRYVQR